MLKLVTHSFGDAGAWTPGAFGESSQHEFSRQRLSGSPNGDDATYRTMAGLVPPEAYTVHMTGSGGASGITLAEIYDATPAPGNHDRRPRLQNLSVRTLVTNDTPVIAGFALGGSERRQILVRAVGPGLRSLGVDDALAENDNWGGGTALRSAFEAVGAFPIAAGDSLDAALLTTLEPGTYIAHVTSGGASGSVVVEIYEVGP